VQRSLQESEMTGSSEQSSQLLCTQEEKEAESTVKSERKISEYSSY
jgi:hypothetical protein